MTLVSVVMAAFNAEDYIGHALESLLDQTHGHLEILVADDGSADGTRSLINRYAERDQRIKALHNEANLGVVRTRNKLLKMSTGSLITLLDADDWIAPRKIEKQVRHLTETGLGAVGVGYFIASAGEAPVAAISTGSKQSLQTGDIFDLPFWPPSIMITRQILDKVGGYHPYFEDFACYEDLYWMYDILACSPVGFITEPLYYYRQNPASLVRTLNLKRLAGKDLVGELIRQRLATGSDWLTREQPELADAFIERMLSDRRWVGGSYRTYAAIKTDERRLSEAFWMLAQAVRRDPASLSNMKTALYLARVAAKRVATGDGKPPS